MLQRIKGIWAYYEKESPRQIKDRFFRSMLENPKIAREMIQSRLPQELASRCQWETLQLESSYAYADTFKEQIVDAILSVKLDKSRQHDLHLMVHFEHLSQPNRWITLDFRHFREQYYHNLIYSKKVKKLPLVYPILVYQGSEPFPFSGDFYDLFEEPALARKYADKAIDIINVCEVPDEEVRRHPYAAFLELTLKHTAVSTNSSDFEQVLRTVLVPMVKKLYQEDKLGFKKPMYGFVRYLFATAPFTDKRKLANIVSRIDKEEGGTMLSLAEHLQKESFAQGVQQGVQQEKQNLLIAMLRKGKRPEEVANLTDQPLSLVREIAAVLHR